ncbi:phage virion morphogenesis (putative tail completion) protein [Desulforamulus putei DSM 12395]|uniref:Phage virion morphogenesis (Putative tail completion) protein n=2 Tax=Desulforamulus putei TaxID=74701 RepID=A0A1M5BTF5_9FIRM|nr:phage virion morphogenesis protein [Desulforamulus putei]SHF45833.1 phage virion morphogenesis (putative tail completion) protein [Desulforamulus putei DSM 12395]
MYSIRLEGDVRKLMKKLRGLENVDLKGAGLTLAEALRTSTRERFQQQKSPEGKPWKKSIRAIQEGGATLTDSAGLKNSIKSTADSTGFAVGTNKVYARTHQFGEKGRKVTIRAKTSRGLIFQVGGRWIRKKQVTVNIKIPARPFLGISEEDMQEIRGTLEDIIAEA